MMLSIVLIVIMSSILAFYIDRLHIDTEDGIKLDVKYIKNGISMWRTAFIFILNFGISYYLVDITIFNVVIVPILFALFLLDLRCYILPDVLVLLLALVAVFRWIYIDPTFDSLLFILVGGAVGFGFFLLLNLATKGGMAAGDVKLMGALGLLVGTKLIILITCLSFLIGGIFAAYIMLTRKGNAKTPMPFGPYICVAALIAFNWGNLIVYLYLTGEWRYLL